MFFPSSGDLKCTASLCDKLMGGLSLPNFQHCYWAANSRALMYRQDALPGKVSASTPSWLAIEQDLSKSSLPALLFSPAKFSTSITVNNLIVTNSLKIWHQLRKSFIFPDTSVHSPVCYNHAFPPSLTDSTFALWGNKGITAIANLYNDNTFATFAQLKDKYSLPASHFFCYLQIRDYVHTNISILESITPHWTVYFYETGPWFKETYLSVR